MPITFPCSCGKSLRVPDEHAGKRVKCPACGGVATAPKSEPAPSFEVVEDEPLTPLPPPKARPVAKPVAVDDEDEDDDRRGYAVSSRRDDADERPKKRPKWKTDRDDCEERRERPRGGDSSAGTEIAGGLLAMVGAVVWFVVGLANDRIFFYPPFLFIAGLVGLIKGLRGG